MDYGAILIPSIMGIYFLTRYIKDKKGFSLVMIIISIIGILYRTAFGIYANAAQLTQTIIDIVYWVIIIIFMIVHIKKEKSKENTKKL